MSVDKDLLSSTPPESDSEEVAAVEASDSSSTILTPQSNNHPCYGNNATYMGQKFKGIVQQQNGHWGAQIYANHQRIWLGTFKSDEEEAMAYDSAVFKLYESADMVMFYECSCHDQEGREEKKFYMIDVVKRKGGNVDIKTTIKCLDEEDVIEGDSNGSPDVKTGKQQGFKLLGRLWREITIPGVDSIVSFAFPFRDQKKV